ncbi:MAG: DUF1385 domain-containing protein [candidate division Zixibacteria bacterium]|nr:DUF1385 domain-containing protein [candidate division Zixibacteria bacterium]
MPDLAVGGQAVIEGVMMRSDDRIATAVRVPSGEIKVKTDTFISLTKRFKFLGIPVLRGAVSFIEMLVIGIKSLNFSADVAVAEIEKEEAAKNGTVYKEKEKKKSNALLLAGTVVFALGLGITIFFFLPLALSTLIGIEKDALSFNLVAGCIRVLLFLAYVWGISFISDFRRVFAYHGAEHKSIFAFESGSKMTPDAVAGYPRRHPRCGTSFILIVALFAILIYSISDSIYTVVNGVAPGLFVRFGIHFSLLPLVAGISYELLKLSGRTRDSKITQFLIAPGLWLQSITTKEPSHDQIEVAIVALETVMNITEKSELSVKRIPAT